MLLLSACAHKRDKVIEPIRANGIPEKAFWIGSVDGGNWYLIDDEQEDRNNAIIRIYNDNDGTLIVSKRFILICPGDNQTLMSDLKEKISGFDGERIFLISGGNKKDCYLK